MLGYFLSVSVHQNGQSCQKESLQARATSSEAVAADVAKIALTTFLTTDEATPHRKIMYPSTATAKNWDEQEEATQKQRISRVEVREHHQDDL